jgi:hypothetical protein
MNEIFISYSRRDKAFVERFLDGLKNNGYSSDNIWVDWEDIPASSDWEAEIKKGIETANSIIFILSPEWAKSGECAKELKFATEYNKRLFPIVWQNVDPNSIQKELGSINWIFFRETDNFDEAMQKLLSAIKTDLGWVSQHTTLLTRANEWNTKNRDDGYLLRGSELQEAETWLSQAGDEEKQPRPTPLQSEYIYASRQEDVQRQRCTGGFDRPSDYGGHFRDLSFATKPESIGESVSCAIHCPGKYSARSIYSIKSGSELHRR